MDLITPRGPQPHDGFLLVLKKHRGPPGKQSPMCRKSGWALLLVIDQLHMLGKGIKGKKQMFIDGLSSLERSRCSTSGPHLAYENFTSSPVDRILNLDVAFFRGLYQLLLNPSSPRLKTLLVSTPFSFPWQAGDAGSFRVCGGWKGSLGLIFLSVTQIISWRKNAAVFVLQSFMW